MQNRNSIKGYIVLKDNEGNTLFKGENKIVESGKRFIYDRVFRNTSSDSLADYDFAYIVVGNNNAEVNKSDTYVGVFGSDGAPISVKIASANSREDVSTDGTLYREFLISFSGESGLLTNINTLGILIASGPTLDDNKTLFSRIKFDTVPVTTESQFTLSYYLYF